jgi:hypothetical protein
MAQIYLHSLLSLMLLAQSVLYEPDKRPDLIAFALDGFDPGINRSIGEDDAAKKILQRFGKPRQMKSRQEASKREPGGINDINTWHYDGLEIITLGWVGYSEQWVEKITLTSPNFKLKFGLKIGSPKSAFTKLLGQPWREEPGLVQYWATYYESREGVAFVSHPYLDIEFDAENRAKKITWRFGSD